jgi:hypothetical protein
LSTSLNFCLNYPIEIIEAVCDSGECPHMRFAHDTLKYSAKYEEKFIYDEWWNKREGKILICSFDFLDNFSDARLIRRVIFSYAILKLEVVRWIEMYGLEL